MGGMITVRTERLEDRGATAAVLTSAFSQDLEARLVEALRHSTGFVEELSLVAEVDGRIVGYCLFTPAGIGECADRALALAPLAVLPEFQGRGVGSELVRHGLAAGRARGFGAVIVVGHPEYYPRFGFAPARHLGLTPPFPAPDEVFMALELFPGALHGCGGVVRYPPVFDMAL